MTIWEATAKDEDKSPERNLSPQSQDERSPARGRIEPKAPSPELSVNNMRRVDLPMPGVTRKNGLVAPAAPAKSALPSTRKKKTLPLVQKRPSNEFALSNGAPGEHSVNIEAEQKVLSYNPALLPREKPATK